MVKVVKRFLCNDDISSPVHVVQDAPCGVGDILDVHVIVINNQKLCEHHLAFAPQAVDNLLCVAGVDYNVIFTKF